LKDPAKRISEVCLTLAVIFIVSYLLNFVWESLHGVFLYKGHNFDAKRYVRMVVYTSAVDGSLIVGIYLFTAFLWKDILWLQKTRRKEVYTVLILGLVTAALIEFRKVLILRTWSYNNLMPTVFGIGLSPLLQLSITGLLTFWLTRKILNCPKGY
jgi:hypothetical protein